MKKTIVDNNIYASKKRPANIVDNRVFVEDFNGKRILLQADLVTYIEQICSVRNLTGLRVDLLAEKVYGQLKRVNTMADIDEQIVICAADLSVKHYMYPYISTYIEVRDLHAKTSADYYEVCRNLRENINHDNGEPAPIITQEFLDFVEKNRDRLNTAFVYDRDYNINFFGLRTLKKAYLKRLHNGRIIERPQHVYMRVAIEVHYRTNDIDRVIETYDLMSRGKFTHATPTLYNAGTPYPQLSSCFLLGIADDSMESIAKCWKDAAIISKYAGGIGINGSNIRVNGAYIKSTQGRASGLRMLTVFNAVARYADQGGKRPGSIAFYLEPWHGDVFFFLDLKKNTGAETERARDLFLALAINDIFMKRVKENGVWSLMCPSKCPNIVGKYGTEFETAYIEYETQGKYLKQIPARELFYKIMETQIESGVPYILFKDSVNYKSNQKNVGTINGSNLCIEIVEYTAPDEYAVCFTADTLIETIDGSKRLDSINSDSVLSVYKSDTEFEQTMSYVKSKLILNGTKPVYKLTTKNGYSIKTTNNHPFLVSIAGQYVWRKAGELTTEDSIIIYTKNSVDHTYMISFEYVGEDLVYDLTVPDSHNFVANGFVVHNCNLASIALPAFIKDNTYDYNELYRVSRVITRNLNNVIDFNFYPVPETRNSNMRHRPIGMGVQGLADVFAMLHLPFDSAEARDINKKIFETIYFGAMTESNILAKESGPYSTFVGSPISQGLFQFNLWGLTDNETSGMWDWKSLREEIIKHGVRNSLTTACMPTASTSQILGWNECIEPYTENIYTRTTTAGDFFVINKHLMKDLMELNLWNDDIIDMIKMEEGSVRRIPGIPQKIKDIYRTGWEISKKSMIEMSADRGKFIDQTQSFNIFIARPTYQVLTSVLMYGWELGLKTGMYYLRSKPVSKPNQFGIDIDRINRFKKLLGDDVEEQPVENVSNKTQVDRVCVFKPKHLRTQEDCDVCGS